MTEWLDLMLDEVRRKSDEAADVAAEEERRRKDMSPNPGGSGGPASRSAARKSPAVRAPAGSRKKS